MANDKPLNGILETDKDQFWEGIADAAVREMHKIYDEPAKQIITVSGVLQGLYFVAISFSTLKNQTDLNCIWDRFFGVIFIIPILSWLASLFFAICILIPKFKTGIYRDSPSIIQKKWEYNINSKAKNLRFAQIFLAIGFLFVVVSICCYLFFFHTPNYSCLYNNITINSS